MRAAKRGVRLTVIVETPDKIEGQGEYSTIKALGQEVAACSTVYFWPKENRPLGDNNKVGILHVKCVVADGEWLFLSSANLTQQAFTINMELGMLVRGGTIPKRVEQQFERLNPKRRIEAGVTKDEAISDLLPIESVKEIPTIPSELSRSDCNRTSWLECSSRWVCSETVDREKPMYDLIGDIHGHADELVQLLETLRYQKAQGVYRHSERKVIFLGDFIDRGPKIREVLEIVRPMIEERTALAVMGNHELNAMAYHSEDPDNPGEYLRRHSDKNVHQHRKTVEQLKPDELQSYLDWFRTLPMWLDLDGLRVVHACWDERSVTTIAAALDEQRGITPALLHSACKKGKALFAPVEVVLKGKEAALPDGKFFHDKDGNNRTEIRSRWYLPPHGQTYRSYALQSDPIACDLLLDQAVIEKAAPYPIVSQASFRRTLLAFGRATRNPCRKRGLSGFQRCQGRVLVAYRWQGEQKLSNDHFAWVRDGKAHGI